MKLDKTGRPVYAPHAGLGTLWCGTAHRDPIAARRCAEEWEAELREGPFAHPMTVQSFLARGSRGRYVCIAFNTDLHPTMARTPLQEPADG